MERKSQTQTELHDLHEVPVLCPFCWTSSFSQGFFFWFVVQLSNSFAFPRPDNSLVLQWMSSAFREGEKVNLLSGILKWCVYKNMVKPCQFNMTSLRLWKWCTNNSPGLQPIFIMSSVHGLMQWQHLEGLITLADKRLIYYMWPIWPHVLASSGIPKRFARWCSYIQESSGGVFFLGFKCYPSVWHRVNKRFYKSENLSKMWRMLKRCHKLSVCTQLRWH